MNSATRCTLIPVCILIASANLFAQNASESYPIELKPDDVYHITKLAIEINNLRITADAVTVMPIRCEKGITGCMILGDGQFHFSPDGKADLKGQFRGGMFRFNPAQQEQFIQFDKAKATTDRATHAMCSHLLKPLFNHCWQSNGKALIPDTNVFAVCLYSKDHGDILISTQEDSFVVYNFSNRKRLYADK